MRSCSGITEDHLALITDGDEVVVGDFTIRVKESLHSPGDRFPGTISAPLATPARLTAYRTDACFSFIVEHPSGTMLIHPSANVIPHQFDGLRVDFVYLGVGALGAQSDSFRRDYWRDVVLATRPRWFVPIHWDNFTRSLDRPLMPLPFPVDRMAATRDFLIQAAGEARIPWRFQQAFESIRPFASSAECPAHSESR